MLAKNTKFIRNYPEALSIKSISNKVQHKINYISKKRNNVHNIFHEKYAAVSEWIDKKNTIGLDTE